MTTLTGAPMTKPICLDLFCGAGGAGHGYALAGFTVIGVDIDPHPSFPYEFHQDDALRALEEVVTTGAYRGHVIDLVHASPPCQAYTNAAKIMKQEHPDLVGPVRELLHQWGGPYIIENVPGSPLIDPVELCGAMFPGLRTYRHRLFESNMHLRAPKHPDHIWRTTKMGRKPVPGEFMHVVGNFSGVKEAREAMGIPWMTRDDLRESIPPAYTEHLGHQALTILTCIKRVAA